MIFPRNADRPAVRHDTRKFLAVVGDPRKHCLREAKAVIVTLNEEVC